MAWKPGQVLVLDFGVFDHRFHGIHEMTPYLGAVKTLELALKDLKIPYVREYRFDTDREWRADFLLAPDILVEIDGGVWSRGRHTRGQGFLNDLEKLNRAVELGYRPLRYCTQDALELKCLPQIRRVVKRGL